jgi:hypothetical protein
MKNWELLGANSLILPIFIFSPSIFSWRRRANRIRSNKLAKAGGKHTTAFGEHSQQAGRHDDRHGTNHHHIIAIQTLKLALFAGFAISHIAVPVLSSFLPFSISKLKKNHVFSTKVWPSKFPFLPTHFQISIQVGRLTCGRNFFIQIHQLSRRLSK